MDEEANEVVEQTPVQETTEKQPETHADNSASVNMARLREAKEKVEREKDDMAARLKEYEDAAKLPKEEAPQYGAEDFVEGKHLKSEIDSVKKQLETYKAQQAEEIANTQLRSKFPDYDVMMTPENIKKLEGTDPEMATALAHSNASYYAKAAAVYKMVKERNLVVPDNHAQDRQSAQDNAAKPRPSNSVSPQTGDSALSMANAFANGLTEDLKKQLWKEMQDSAKKL